MQINKFSKIPKVIIFVVGLLLCGFATFFWLSGFDEIWDGFTFSFFLAGWFIIYMSVGIGMIIIALHKQMRASKKFTLKVIGTILIGLLGLAIWSSFQKIGMFLPGKDYVADYTSANKKYILETQYDNQKHPTGFEVVDARTGGVVGGYGLEDIKPKVNRYEIKETTSSMIFIFYDTQNKEVIDSSKYAINGFNTETGNWISK